MAKALGSMVRLQRTSAPARSLVGLRIGATHCAVETAAVIGVLGADDSLLAGAHPSALVIGLKEHAGALVPIVDLRRWKGFSTGVAAVSARPRWLLVRGASGPFGIAADEVSGVFEASVDEERPVALAAVGALVRVGLANGRVTALELDLDVIASALGASGDRA